MNRLGFAAIALAVIVLAGAATLFSSSPAAANPGNIPTSGILYATDGGGGKLYSVNPTTGATTPIGSLGVGPFPALAGNATTIYGGTGNDALNPPGRLYSVNPSGPSAALIGASGLGYAGYGSFDFDNSGILYASMNLAGGSGTGSDYLVTVAIGGGAASVVGPFGTCMGVTIPVPDPSAGGPTGSCTIDGIEGIAFDSSGQLWGVERERGTAGASGLYKINKATGAATFVMAITGTPSDGVVSLQFACNGTLYGGSSRHPDGGRLGTINTTTGAWTYLTPARPPSGIDPSWTGGPQYNSMSGLAIVPSTCPFNVNKVFVPSDVGQVTVSLSCTDGGVAVASDNTASQADDANFTVTGFTLGSNPTCTATETNVPAGYTINQCSATLSAGVCTITNHETTTTFTVNKVYSPAGPLTTVPVTVTCSSGTVTTPAGNSGPGAPFSTVVHHFNLTGTTCSASETVPAGYIMTSTCTNVPISDSVPASCTITNTETTTTLTVNKVYSPANPHPAVPITVTCTSGIVTTPAGNAAPGSPFSTVVHKFNVAGTTCTALETVPAGYTESDDCGSVSISNGVPASCTFINSFLVISCLPTPSSPCPVGGLVDVVTSGSSGSGSAMSWLAVLVLAVVAIGAVAGGTFAVVRKRW
jgi:hypothetical protein